MGIVAAGCEGAGARFESVDQAIIAGTPVSGDPAIMAMLSFMGNRGARCTATLITPRLLIAAAHCIVETPGFERHIFPVNNDRNGAATEMLAIKAVVPNPAYGAPRQGNDFCIIVLEAPLAIRPVRLNRAALAGAQGKTVRYVGYGLSVVGNPGSGGIKRQNTAPLAQVSDLLLTIAPNANQSCEGDSGGPLLLEMGDGQGEAIIGINSFVDAPACRRNSFFQRVDTQLAWIDEQIKKYDPDMLPPADGGAGDAQGPAILDAAPEASSPMPDPTPTPPVAPTDAQAPTTGGPSVPPTTGDAGGGRAPGAPDVGPQRGPTASPGDAAVGCRFSGNASPAGSGGVGTTVTVALMLAWAARRRRRRGGGAGMAAMRSWHVVAFLLTVIAGCSGNSSSSGGGAGALDAAPAGGGRGGGQGTAGSGGTGGNGGSGGQRRQRRQVGGRHRGECRVRRQRRDRRRRRVGRRRPARPDAGGAVDSGAGGAANPANVIWYADPATGNAVFKNVETEGGCTVTVIDDPEHGKVRKFNRPPGTNRCEAKGAAGYNTKEGDLVYVGMRYKIEAPMDLTVTGIFQWKTYDTPGHPNTLNFPLLIRPSAGRLNVEVQKPATATGRRRPQRRHRHLVHPHAHRPVVHHRPRHQAVLRPEGRLGRGLLQRPATEALRRLHALVLPDPRRRLHRSQVGHLRHDQQPQAPVRQLRRRHSHRQGLRLRRAGIVLTRTDPRSIDDERIRMGDRRGGSFAVVPFTLDELSLGEVRFLFGVSGGALITCVAEMPSSAGHSTYAEGRRPGYWH